MNSSYAEKYLFSTRQYNKLAKRQQHIRSVSRTSDIKLSEEIEDNLDYFGGSE